MCKQDHQALLMSKYRPRVGAALCTQKSPPPAKKVTLILKFNSVRAVVNVHVHAKLHHKLTAEVRELITVH